ncbi:D-glycero-beta-D-manno-heptose 1-phosphate adenylyltransferase [Nocardioides sp. SOB77]|uniref:D-glycero-beta-D-manno-heptose 1-phosphate adenylyltransferase n=1 Tax=Nocardioides oceani TaxID=3058369 RepID=A0ABT8FLQ0_9ACTN|nr:D-glycero-beta-D-manno-heptose 1-phosphate adenylyltransferase [Nocardioides oceani]MDN4175464.1 D-glycero-beta-D-manno-heptose 1-phosphate adenylyltransferase [Nocardioides oceani]
MSRGPLVVVGDALLDVDLEGRAGRLCPDAPVPVLDDLVEHPRPGGAGLAAALAARDGHEVVLVSAVADDADGERLVALLDSYAVRLVRVPHAGSTSVKKRVRSAGQSLLRLDTGTAGAVGPAPEAALAAIASAGAVLVADYGRGLTAEPAVREALAAAAGRVPVVWDPHPRGAAPVPGVRLVTPNRDEAAHFAGDVGAGARTPLGEVSARAAALVERWSAAAVAVTLGERGALLSHGESSPSVLPAPRVGATDPCGAGDRFASAAAGALATGALTTEAVQAAVLAAAHFVAGGGAAGFGRSGPGAADRGSAAAGLDRVELVRAAGGTVVATGGCFDLLHAGHVATLEAARALGDCLVVCLNSDASVRRLKGASRPLVPQDDRARVLAALEPVDAVVVFDEDTPTEALRRVRPDVWAKGGDYAGVELPEAALLREWGGQSVVLPYLQGRSTTSLVATAAQRAGAGR